VASEFTGSSCKKNRKLKIKVGHKPRTYKIKKLIDKNKTSE
jgi:hypothetical protein